MMPPGRATTRIEIPNNTDSASASPAETPANPIAATMAPSRTPQPASEIGNMDASTTGGTSTRQARRLTSIPIPRANTNTSTAMRT